MVETPARAVEIVKLILTCSRNPDVVSATCCFDLHELSDATFQRFMVDLIHQFTISFSELQATCCGSTRSCTCT